MDSRPLQSLLRDLTRRARDAGWSDAEWARQTGMAKETLCRLRSRSSCDFATLHALSAALGVSLQILDVDPPTTTEGHWPAEVDRALELRLSDRALSGSTRPEDWRSLGPSFFVAGLAVVLASVTGFDRPRYLALAEALHPGATELPVFARWLEGTPLPPARFLPPIFAALERVAP